MNPPYSTDPTSDGDIQAELMREWYEHNRESMWDRIMHRPDQADEFMLGMLGQARRIMNHEVPYTPSRDVGDD